MKSFEEELKNIVFLRWLWLVKITGKRWWCWLVWWKGLRLFGKSWSGRIWLYCTRALISHFWLVAELSLVFFSHIPPWGRSCPSVVYSPRGLSYSVWSGKVCCQLDALPICAKGEGGDCTSWHPVMKLTLDLTLAPDFSHQPVEDDCECTFVPSHCQSSGCVWNHPWLGALREACALVLLKI